MRGQLVLMLVGPMALALAACGSTPVGELPEPAGPDRSPAQVAPSAATVLARGADVELLAAPGAGAIVHGARGAAELQLRPLEGGPGRRLQLPGPAAALTADQHGGLLVALGSGELVRVSRAQLRRARPAPITLRGRVAAPTALAPTREGAVVVSRAASQLAVVPDASVVLDAPRDPLSVASLRGGQLAVTVGGRAREVELVRLHGGRAEAIERVAAGVGPTQVACAEGGPCFVVDTAGDALLVVRVAADGSGLRVSRRVFLGGAPYAIAIDRDRRRLWVALSARNEVVELGAHGRPHVLRRLAAPQQPDAIAVDPSSGDVVLGGRAAGELWRYAPFG